MYINQLSVFVQNKKGSLSEVTRLLADANIDIRAFSIADTSDYGILRMVVSDPSGAEKVLKDAGIAVSLTKVVGVKLPDKPGSMSSVLELLTDENISVEYAYAFISRSKDYAYVLLRVDDPDSVSDTLVSKGVEVVGENEVFSL